MSKTRFEVRFAPDAVKEYERLDRSVLNIVNNAIDKLEERADQVGKPLSNLQNTKLAGCREIKLKKEGIRIIYMVSNEVIDILQIVYILTIESLANDRVFKVANKRLKGLKENPSETIQFVENHSGKK